MTKATTTCSPRKVHNRVLFDRLSFRKRIWDAMFRTSSPLRQGLKRHSYKLGRYKRGRAIESGYLLHPCCLIYLYNQFLAPLTIIYLPQPYTIKQSVGAHIIGSDDGFLCRSPKWCWMLMATLFLASVTTTATIIAINNYPPTIYITAHL